SLSHRFSPEDAQAKERLLDTVRSRSIRSARLLLRYHEILCFLRAYPDSPALLRVSEDELQNFAARVAIAAGDDGYALEALRNTGIAGTVVEYPFDFDMALWLAEKFPNDVVIDWEAYNDLEADNLAIVLPLLANWVENDNLDDPEQGTEDWVTVAAGQKQNDFRWFLSSLTASPFPREIQNYLYEQIELPLQWQLADSDVSRSRARYNAKRMYYQRGPIMRPKGGFRQEIVRRLHPLKPLPKREANKLIDLTRGALLVRQRELYPVDHANPAEVFLADAGRGIQVAIIGSVPEFRLPLEADYAAFLIKNGLPIGYGVGAVLFDRVEIAINVFDTFRGGEAAYILAQFFRIFHQHFGVTNFIIRRYQIGYENEEGLAAGAYWFYYKLGLRSFDEETAELAEEEFTKIQADKRYRTPRKTLKKLALSDMYMCLNLDAGVYQELSLSKLSLAATKRIGERYKGDRAAAVRAATSRLSKILDASDWKTWMPDERESFRRLSVLFDVIPDLENWPVRDRRTLAHIMRAKGKPGETDFARRLLKHKRLYEALKSIAET
ncbi:hypothetical protein KKB28_07150, partial [bacterium]|nr:hypothetical protein [bacterium]